MYKRQGIHPHETKDFQNIDSKYIKNLIRENSKIIGIGETGLDYYYNHSDKEIQKRSFIDHIRAASELNIPVIVHSRNAEKDTYEILENEMKNSKLKALIHCFTGSKEFAKKIGFKEAPIDDILTFNMVFGKTVPDISLNSPANLGYASCKFIQPVYVGDTIKTTSKVLGVKENSNKKTGIVWVNSTGKNQRNEVVLDYIRWVMVNKKDESNPAPKTVIPELKDEVSIEDITIPEKLNMSKYDFDESGSKYLWDDYQIGEKIDHIDGMTVEEADHMTATRLYQNTAKVHFNEHTEKEGRLGRRIIYGGHIISLVRMLSFNGLSLSLIHI